MHKQWSIVVGMAMWFVGSLFPNVGLATDAVVLYERPLAPDAWLVGFKLPSGVATPNAVARVLEHLGKLTLRENFDTFSVQQIWDSDTSTISKLADVIASCTPVASVVEEPHCRIVVQVYKKSGDMDTIGSLSALGRMDARRIIEYFRTDL